MKALIHSMGKILFNFLGTFFWTALLGLAVFVFGMVFVF